MDESLKVLERYMMENGPFDGLMGFSQVRAGFSLMRCRRHWLMRNKNAGCNSVMSNCFAPTAWIRLPG